MNMDNRKFEEEKDNFAKKPMEEVNKVTATENDKMDQSDHSTKPEPSVDEVDDTPTNDHDPSIPSEGRGVQGMNMESGQNMYCENPNKK